MFQSLGKMYVCTFGKYTNGTPNLKASGVPPPPAPPPADERTGGGKVSI